MSTFHRTQILLKPEQHAALAKIAAEEQRSISEIYREITAAYLARHSAESKQKNALQWLEQMAAFRKDLAARTTEPMPDPVDILNEQYADEDAEWQRIMQGGA